MLKPGSVMLLALLFLEVALAFWEIFDSMKILQFFLKLNFFNILYVSSSYF